MNQIRFTLMCLIGLGVLLVGGAAGCASTLDDGARVLNTTAAVAQTPATSMTVVDRVTQEAIVAAVRSSTMTVAAAAGPDLACHAERATVLKMTDQTRTTLDSLQPALSGLPASIAASDATVDDELSSRQH